MGINLSKASLQCLQCKVTTYGNWRAIVTSPRKAKMKNWQLTMRFLHAFDSNECVFLYHTRSPLSSNGLCPLLLKWHQGMFSFLLVLGCPLRWIKGILGDCCHVSKAPLWRVDLSSLRSLIIMLCTVCSEPEAFSGAGLQTEGQLSPLISLPHNRRSAICWLLTEMTPRILKQSVSISIVVRGLFFFWRTIIGVYTNLSFALVVPSHRSRDLLLTSFCALESASIATTEYKVSSMLLIY